jgi:hypothetical protein
MECNKWQGTYKGTIKCKKGLENVRRDYGNVRSDYGNVRRDYGMQQMTRNIQRDYEV